MSKLAVVTGATKGIGLAISQALKNKGWEVVGVARNKPEKDLGFEVIPFDLSQTEKLEELVKQLPEKIDLLINNAGISYKKSIEDLTFQDFDDFINVNLKSPVFLTKLFIPRLQKNGIIVNITSDLSCMNEPFYSAYSASKSGVNRFTTALASEKKDLNVFAVLPGMTDTQLLRSIHKDNWDYNTCLKPEDIAEAVIRAADGEFASGSLIVVTNNEMEEWWNERDKYTVINVDTKEDKSCSE